MGFFIELTSERAFTYTIYMGRYDQNDAQKKIAQFFRKNKRMPSYAEVAHLFGFASKNAAYKLVARLIREGVLEKDRTGALLPKKLGNVSTHGARGVPLVGLVEAGLPSLAEEQQLDTISLDHDVVHANNVTYALRVKGESMIDAGIYDGDLVLVEKTEQAKTGDIVVAQIDGDWTLKYLRETRGKKYLEAANLDYPDLYPEQSLQVGGVVRAVIRQLN